MAPVIIKKHPNLEVRIEAREFKGKSHLDIREFGRPHDKEDFKPYKSGLTIPPELVGDVIAAMVAQSKELAVNVVDIEGEETRYVISKNAEDAMMTKKHVFKDEQLALDKSPPDGFRIYKLTVKDGAVVGETALYKRDGGEWVAIKKKKKDAETVKAAGTKKSVKAPAKANKASTSSGARKER